MSAHTAPSTSLASADEGRFAPPALGRFYRWHAPIYDWTRPLILWGRAAVVRGLAIEPDQHVLDIGCGTGWSFPLVAEAGARITGIEPSADMRRRAAARAEGIAGGGGIRLVETPFGIDDRHRGVADRILFSYSLSMIPPYLEVLSAARDALKVGGRIGVVDFLDAVPGVSESLSASHVYLGPERLQALCATFPEHRLRIRRGLLWRYFVFWGDRTS